MTFSRRLAAVLAAALQCSCGLLINGSISPEERAIRDQYRVDEPPPRVHIFVGEVRDFATFRLEPGAVLEFWSEDPNYSPMATLDDKGRYSVRVEACRRDATMAEALFSQALVGDHINCTRWIGRFQFRARLGDRCSLPEPDQAARGTLDPLVLWLRDCQETGSRGHAWRATPAARTATLHW